MKKRRVWERSCAKRQGGWIPCVPQNIELGKQVCSSRKQTNLFPGHRSLWVRLLGAEWGSSLSSLMAETPRSSIQCFCAHPGLGGNTSAEEAPPCTAAAHLGSRLLKACLALFTYSTSPKGFKMIKLHFFHMFESCSMSPCLMLMMRWLPAAQPCPGKLLKATIVFSCS